MLNGTIPHCELLLGHNVFFFGKPEWLAGLVGHETEENKQ
jgi:hypothetical protein